MKAKKFIKPCCVAINCINRSEKGIRLFKFPADNIHRQQWIQNLNRESWTPTKWSYLCEVSLLKFPILACIFLKI